MAVSVAVLSQHKSLASIPTFQVTGIGAHSSLAHSCLLLLHAAAGSPVCCNCLYCWNRETIPMGTRAGEAWLQNVLYETGVWRSAGALVFDPGHFCMN